MYLINALEFIFKFQENNKTQVFLFFQANI